MNRELHFHDDSVCRLDFIAVFDSDSLRDHTGDVSSSGLRLGDEAGSETPPVCSTLNRYDYQSLLIYPIREEHGMNAH